MSENRTAKSAKYTKEDVLSSLAFVLFAYFVVGYSDQTTFNDKLHRRADLLRRIGQVGRGDASWRRKRLEHPTGSGAP